MAENVTPMMRQYQRIKSEISEDVILMFRLGDFYEMFYEDAQRAAPILGVALTKRAGYPMCGVPYHAIDAYLAKLVKAGKKIAICEQVEDPATAKGIVRREITRIITPGTITEENILVDNLNNYLVSVVSNNGKTSSEYVIAALDLSTGELFAEILESEVAAIDALQRIAPGEGIVPDLGDVESEASVLMKEARISCITKVEEWFYDEAASYGLLTRHFGVKSLEGFGCEGNMGIASAAGALLQHVRDNLRRDISHIRSIRLNRGNGYMVLDEATCNHLDLVQQKGRTKESTLFDVLNVTRTPMGARLLNKWILRPLQDLQEINDRHSSIEAFYSARSDLTAMRNALVEVRDLERVIARVSLGRGNPRDLQSISNALKVVPEVRERLSRVAESSRLLEQLKEALEPMKELTEEIDATIEDAAPINFTEGGVIRKGISLELDELRSAASDGRSWIANYQSNEIARTGIKTLKVRYNKVFGYFIEVSIGQIANVPDNYVRKQTMVNCERYTTAELKEMEDKISGAAIHALEMEQRIFEELRDKVVVQTGKIQNIATALAMLDVIMSLTDRALALGYVRPKMTEDDSLIIVNGRHPIVETLPEGERFVPNDTNLNCSDRQIMIITGPNMAGKSTYIRQVAVLVVMAQLGSFIPADEAVIGVVDRVFTRVGASDDLARGRSTFMVEMQETANILNNATPKSLIVLDEIGRGTSTFDGISIAWAVAEYLHNESKVKAKTLFATHYHELTDLSLTLTGVVNCSVLVREQNDGIVFLRKIVDGAADKSYGIAVAKLAGMPDRVINRAKEILSNLEDDELNEIGKPVIAETRDKARRVKEVLEDKTMLLF